MASPMRSGRRRRGLEEVGVCEWGKSTVVRVNVPAGLSYTGRNRWTRKPVDSCLAPLVAALNRGGILTASSCCGHGREPGFVLLQDGRVLIVSRKEPE